MLNVFVETCKFIPSVSAKSIGTCIFDAKSEMPTSLAIPFGVSHETGGADF